ncbi:MAG: type III PLP-dependent enzyme [Xanthobacteraceae bacterium]|nr:type III PLP-dependent enzyme [Xanthobacteraceae bacterium]
MLPRDRGALNLGLQLAREHFCIDGADLIIGGVRARDIAAGAGTPFYAYDGARMRKAYRTLSDALQGFADIHYSVKANPAAAVVRLFIEEGAGAEVASLGEYRTAREAGAASERILFAGPGKRLRELEEVLAGGIGEIHLESYEEIQRVAAVAQRLNRPAKVALRINPVPAVQAGAMRMGGKPTAFGFDEEDLAQAVQAVVSTGTLRLAGIHVYAGTQILDADALVAQWRHAIMLAGVVADLIDGPLATIDLGGGLGIPYHAGDKPLDLAKVAEAVPSLRAALRAHARLTQARIVVEPGRFLAGPAGVYVVEVNAVKQSRGARFLVTDGGMHHHLAASGNLGQIIKRDYPIVAPARMDSEHDRHVAVAGPLCTPLDVLAREALLPDLKAGDLIAVLQSGAYGASASPGRFLGHPPPAEVLVENGAFRAV